MVTTRALSARSVLASILLGTHPPRLSSRALVAAGELFDISEGTVRTALSRMTAAGELVAVDGSYELAGALLDRQLRQDRSRSADRPADGAADRDSWDGRWILAVVRDERRDAARRAELRTVASRLHFGALRDGVWTRPGNIEVGSTSSEGAVMVDQCHLFRGEPEGGPHALVAELWDLDGWAATSVDLVEQLAGATPALEAGDPSVLRDGFVLSAAVLRHVLADPDLPVELLPVDWPGAGLRDRYDRFDAAYRSVLQSWLRTRVASAEN